MTYSYKKLNEMYRTLNKKMKTNKPNRNDAAMAIAVGYAIDLIDISRDTGIALDLTIETEEHLLPAMMQAYTRDIMKGKGIEETRHKLAMMLASYELFTMMNDFSMPEANHGNLFKIIVIDNVLMPVPKLAIEMAPDKDGVVHRFDIYDAAETTMREFHLGMPGENNAFFVGSLHSFFQRRSTDLIRFII